MQALLEQFGQVILYGPPGTGKTREAKRVAVALLYGPHTRGYRCPKCKSSHPPPNEQNAGQHISCPNPSCQTPLRMPFLVGPSTTDEQVEIELADYRKAHRFDLVVFHPAYEYEQFVGGIEPMVAGGQLLFQERPGIFLRLCRQAEQTRLPTVLVIDEINRGNLPKLLGELVYALEYRDRPVTLPFAWEGRTDLVVPKNLYVIATMNSSDRSIGHIDVAIRRRFGLCHLSPNSATVREAWRNAGDDRYGQKLASLMEKLNQALNTGNDPSAEVELGVGHSYFLPTPGSNKEAAKQQVGMKWDHQVQPLLREYAQLLNLGVDSLRAFFKPLAQALAQP